MVNHEASGLRNKGRVLVRPALLVALCVPAAAMAMDGSPSGALALGPADGLSLELAGATPLLQVADAFAAGTSTFTLGLDVALSAERFRTPGLSPQAAAAPPSRAGEVPGLANVRSIAAAMLQETPSSPAPDPAKNDGSFGRWMKRHWWVPALIGAALVATAGESLWDDDDVDDED